MTEEDLDQAILNSAKNAIKALHQGEQQISEEEIREVLRVVKLEAAKKKLNTGGRQNHVAEGTNLRLEFLDGVDSPVQTGKEFKGIKGDLLKVALLDASGDNVNCGPESSAEVEIVLDENISTHENSERKVNGEEDNKNKKPHLTKGFCIPLKEGVGELTDLKLGHGQTWTKLSTCRLRARMVHNSRGITVEEAWTAPFTVIDKRNKRHEKHKPPSLSSEVWRLEKIDKHGEPCKRLKEKNINTVQDFLFWLSVDPDELQKRILQAGESKWKTIVASARSCIIDDKEEYSFRSSTESEISVIYDTVGSLKAVIDEGHYVEIGNLSAKKMDLACKLLYSVLEYPAFGERYRTVYKHEGRLLQEVPYRSSDINASTNSCMQQYSDGTDLLVSGNATVHQKTEGGSSSQLINPGNSYDTVPSVSLGSKDMGELCHPTSGPFPDSEYIVGGTPTDLGTLVSSDYEKHETPSLSGEVCQLVNICRDGEIYKCLQDNKINTVEEFLIQLLVNPEGLRSLVNLEKDQWEATVSKARAYPTESCMMYSYADLLQKKGMISNVQGEVRGLCFENQPYPTHLLSEKEKADAQELLPCARKNCWNIRPFNDVNGPHLTGLPPTRTDPPDSLHPGDGSSNAVTSELVGESSRKRSNTSLMGTEIIEDHFRAPSYKPGPGLLIPESPHQDGGFWIGEPSRKRANTSLLNTEIFEDYFCPPFDEPGPGPLIPDFLHPYQIGESTKKSSNTSLMDFEWFEDHFCLPSPVSSHPGGGCQNAGTSELEGGSSSTMEYLYDVDYLDKLLPSLPSSPNPMLSNFEENL